MSHWMLLADGSRHYLGGYEMAYNEYNVPVLAHHIAQLARFTGAAARPYSVAEHSLLCADIAHEAGHGPAVQLACLVHDLHEAITNDISSPAKWLLGTAWDSFEQPHARALRRALGLQTVFTAHRAAIKHIDLVALATERRDLMPWWPETSEPWPIIDTPGREVYPCTTSLTTAKREQMHWSEWRDAFTARYAELRGQMLRAHQRNVLEVAGGHLGIDHTPTGGARP